MPRYHFHTQDGACLADVDGIELANLDAAKTAAAELLGEMLADDADSFWDTEDFKVIVTDNAGLTLFVLEVSMIPSPATMPVKPAL